ncbi:TniQ protein [Paraburkholderia sp. BL6669N2]|uniref:TnsD family Tn7-like transposition protein n=1 Tax=Paraburkholderia sp. BL6669N2 TaxID=1938807 RepID=UPI000E277C15|nr:TniQ protein [Paraburkholderia sp. BL6669N2]
MAISLFPLNEGETLESNFSRYACYMNLKSTSSLWRRLFGHQCRSGTRLPCGISNLVLQTRDYWGLKADQIIEMATEFNYIAMMVSPEIRARMRETMRNPREAGALRLAFPFKSRCDVGVRYCDACLSDWRRAGVAPYLKISHQLPGSYYCEIHLRLLKAGSFSPVSTALMEITAAEEKAIKKISIDNAQQLASGSNRERAHYVRLVHDAGYITPDGRLRSTELIRDWLAFFGPAYCRLTAIHESKILWWWKFVSTDSIKLTFPHPFIFLAADVLFEAHGKFAGPHLPTRSQSMPAANQPTMPECSGLLHRDSDSFGAATRVRRSGRWIVKCTCGISYKTSPDASVCGERMVPYAYGDRYREHLHGLLAAGCTRLGAAREIGIGESTAANWIRAKVFARMPEKARAKKISRSEIEALRRKWQKLVRDAPPDRRISSAYLAGTTIWNALAFHDHAWLMGFNHAHRSPNRSRVPPKNNPCENDIVRLHEIRDEQLRVEPPVRISGSGILRAADLREAVRSNKKWSSLLQELAESRSAYFERVLEWLGRVAPSDRPRNIAEFATLTHLSWHALTGQQRTRVRGCFRVR